MHHLPHPQAIQDLISPCFSLAFMICGRVSSFPLVPDHVSFSAPLVPPV
jgi:hypothetical protein